MFASKGKTTVIAEGLRIIGSVSADGAVQVNGQIDGDLNCTSITVSPKALINGTIKARSVVINGKVEGPNQRSRRCSQTARFRHRRHSGPLPID